MLFSLLFISSSDFVYGNEIFFVSINQHADLAPINSSYFFQAPENLYLETQDQKRKEGPIRQGQFLQLSNANTQVRSFSESLGSLIVWHVPFSQCPPGGNVYFSADRLISFETDTEKLKRDFCIFPQTNIYAQEFSGSFTTDNPMCKLEFYEGTNMEHIYVKNWHHHHKHHRTLHSLWLKSHKTRHNRTSLIEPRFTVQPNVSFHYSFYDAFFMRFSGCSGHYLNTSFVSSVMRPSSESEDCVVDSIPAVTKSGGMKMKNPLGYVKITSCENVASSDALALFLSSGALFAFTLFIFVLFLLPKKKRSYRNTL